MILARRGGGSSSKFLTGVLQVVPPVPFTCFLPFVYHIFLLFFEKWWSSSSRSRRSCCCWCWWCCCCGRRRQCVRFIWSVRWCIQIRVMLVIVYRADGDVWYVCWYFRNNLVMCCRCVGDASATFWWCVGSSLVASHKFKLIFLCTLARWTTRSRSFRQFSYE